MVQNSIIVDLDDLLVSEDLFLKCIEEIEISDFVWNQNKLSAIVNDVPYVVLLYNDYFEINLKYSNTEISNLYSYYLGQTFGYYAKKQISLQNLNINILNSNCISNSIIAQVSNPEILENILNRFNKDYDAVLKLVEIEKYEVPLCKIEGRLNSFLMFYIGWEETYFSKKFEDTSIWPF